MKQLIGFIRSGRLAVGALIVGALLALGPDVAVAGVGDSLKAAAQRLNDRVAKPAASSASSAGAVTPVGASSGPLAAVLSKDKLSSFAEAQGRAISEVRDGDPVYLYLRLAQPLEQLVARWTTAPDVKFNDRKGIGIHVGPRNSTQTYADDVFIPTEAELKATELRIDLAPGEVRPLTLSGWLRTVGGGMAGRWDNEIRIVQLGGEHQVLARLPLTANVVDGIDKYRKQLADYKRRQDAGDVSFNELPEKGRLTENGVLRDVGTVLARSQGLKFSALYLTGDAWYEDRNPLGQLEKLHTSALGLWRDGSRCMAVIINVDRWMPSQRVDAQANSRFEVTCDRYKKAGGN